MNKTYLTWFVCKVLSVGSNQKDRSSQRQGSSIQWNPLTIGFPLSYSYKALGIVHRSSERGSQISESIKQNVRSMYWFNWTMAYVISNLPHTNFLCLKAVCLQYSWCVPWRTLRLIVILLCVVYIVRKLTSRPSLSSKAVYLQSYCRFAGQPSCGGWLLHHW